MHFWGSTTRGDFAGRKIYLTPDRLCRILAQHQLLQSTWIGGHREVARLHSSLRTQLGFPSGDDLGVSLAYLCISTPAVFPMRELAGWTNNGGETDRSVNKE